MNNIKSNKSFCMFPWAHMYVHTTGDVYPCCVADQSISLGNVKNSSMKEIWNSENYKKIRKQMMAGELPSSCEICAYREKTVGDNASMRSYANHLLGKHYDIVNNTQTDGYLDEFKLRYIDVRFGNVCNFKCRMCDSRFSSSLAAEKKKQGTLNHPIIIHASDHNKSLLEQIKDHGSYIETIYFAGGEPLLMDEHYEILEYLIENNLTDVSIRYNSNGSNLKYKNYDIIEMWKNFKNINFCISLDSFGSRAEYIRNGTIWNIIISNLQTIRNECPHIELNFSSVLMCFNILTVTEFLENLFENDLFLENSNFSSFNTIVDPSYYRIGILPIELRLLAKQKIEAFINKYNDNPIVYSLKNIIDSNFIENNSENLQLSKKFKKEVMRLDSLRNESFVDTFPELKDWYNSIEVD